MRSVVYDEDRAFLAAMQYSNGVFAGHYISMLVVGTDHALLP